MKRFTIVLALLLTVIGTSIAQKETLINKIAPDLTDEIIRSRNSDDMFHVIIIMNEQFDTQKQTRHMQYLSKAQQREFVVNELQQMSSRSQKEVLNDLQQGKKATLVDDIKSFWIFNGISCFATKEMVQAIAEHPDVKYVMKDLEIHIADGEDSEEIILDRADTAWNVTKVNADKVWKMGYTGAGIIIAIIDTGVNYNHTDIVTNMWDGGSEFPHHGWDFVNNDNDPIDDHSHGTHCAGTASSYGTNGSQCGIAKDAKIMALKVLDSGGSGSFTSCWSAVEFAVSHNADVLNLSLGADGIGGDWLSRVVMENVLSCGVVASVSAGNVGNTYENGQLKYPVPYNVGSPGNCPSPWQHPDQTLVGGLAAVITVGNTTSGDLISPSSSIGPSTWANGDYIGFYNDYPWAENNPDSIGLIKPDISAPGSYIISLDYSNNTGYATKSGTSMAAPCVAGVMALMLSVNPTLTPLEIDSIIETTAVRCRLQTSKNNYYGAGRIDALAAINYMLNACAAPTSLSATVNKANVFLNWDAAENVSSYRVYRNGVMIASSVSETHYTDENAPAGNDTYYIRSNGENHQASLPSNQVTVNITTNVEIGNPGNLKTTNICNGTVTLNWVAPATRNETLSYVTSGNSYYGKPDTTIMAAQKFPSSMLQPYAGMQIEHIYFSLKHADSTCTIKLYEGDEMLTGSKVFEGSFTTTAAEQEMDYSLEHPIAINPNKDLWLTIETSDSVQYYDNYNGEIGNAFLYQFSPFSHWSSNAECAWAFKLGLSDKDYTFNVYRNDNIISSSQIGTSYIDSYADGMNKYQVTSVTNNYESIASNSVMIVNNTASLSDLTINSNDTLIILPNSKLTVTGTLVNATPDRLILEDNAQLIHNSTGVYATVKKNIAAHGTSDGWNFIASPVSGGITPSTDNGLVSGDYDLYYYDETSYHWKNYKNDHQSEFTFADGVGYLYANANNVTLSFAGALNTTTADPTKDVTASAEQLKGFNLVGNPFARKLNINNLALQTENDYSHITGIYQICGRQVIATTNTLLNPCEGFFIQVDNPGTLHFNYPWPANNDQSQSNLRIEVNVATREANLLDRAYIHFGDGHTLNKFTLDANATQIYIPQGNSAYAIASIQSQDEMPLNFKVAENGTYTLDFETENIDLDYLHLVDNLTGVEADLLETPSYTFDAKANDYESRFRLLFTPICKDADGYDEPFAFVANGEIIVAQMYGNAMLQVIDTTGRIVFFGDTMSRVSTSNMTAGIYVLRLITNNDVKTQKIIVE